MRVFWGCILLLWAPALLSFATTCGPLNDSGSDSHDSEGESYIAGLNVDAPSTDYELFARAIVLVMTNTPATNEHLRAHLEAYPHIVSHTYEGERLDQMAERVRNVDAKAIMRPSLQAYAVKLIREFRHQELYDLLKSDPELVNTLDSDDCDLFCYAVEEDNAIATRMVRRIERMPCKIGLRPRRKSI